MKTPLVIASPLRPALDDLGFAAPRSTIRNAAIADAATLRPAVRRALVAHQGLQLLGKKEKKEEDPEDVKGPDYVVEFLRFLKYEDDHIKRIKYYTEAIGKLAAIANWVVEAAGTVPNQTRLFLNPRAGSVRARVDAQFEFNPANPAHPFVGFANVSIGTLEPAVPRHGFILFVEIFETRVGVQPNGADIVREDPVDAMSLHFAPSFLVVDKEYFTDRETGLANMEKAVDSIEDKYRKAKLRLGPRIPIEHVQRAAEEEGLLRATFTEYAERSPSVAQQVTERFAVPVLRR